jgi:hypothetical protein
MVWCGSWPDISMDLFIRSWVELLVWVGVCCVRGGQNHIIREKQSVFLGGKPPK